METFFSTLDAINAVMLSVPVLISLLVMAVLFTFWSGFSQYRSLTHGVALITGRGINTASGKGALTHFQALSAALSGTVGLGNIAGVAIAVQYGGPGAVLWMWVVGLLGMALKSAEVTLSMLYRDTSDPEDPHGGAMYVCRNGLAKLGPGWGKIAKIAGGFFCLSVFTFAVTGGNMFQAWSIGHTTHAYFDVPSWISGLILAALVAVVLIGGVKRIGATADKLVPLMCVVYVFAGLYVLAGNIDQLPGIFRLIFASAFAPTEALGAFTGASLGMAFIFGMKRALFSSESGLGTAPIAHSAVKTNEPVTEGVVAGLEPLIDTLIVCTITALVILSSGLWNRAPDQQWIEPPTFTLAEKNKWQLSPTDLQPADDEDLAKQDQVFVVANIDRERQRIYGRVQHTDIGLEVTWDSVVSDKIPELAESGIFADYGASTLTAKAFDQAQPGLGKWMVTLAVWLFGFSTIITYGYYGEQCVRYFGGGDTSVRHYRVFWCLLVAITCTGFIRTAREVDTLSTVALGFMLAVNLPILAILGSKAMQAWHDYFARLNSGQIARKAS